MSTFRNRNFLYITVADLIVRAAYQMGKTPLLPIFAALLGASDVLLGFIVSVSTLTGMISKPLVGLLSDRWGRRSWLLLGTAFFAFTPFFYWLIETPEQLVVIRIIHGMATAIYGPVTLAYVAENSVRERRAESLGWFGNARTAGYIVGPALAGWMLVYVSAPLIFTFMGIVSCLAFVPIWRLSELQPAGPPTTKPSLWTQAKRGLQASASAPAVWLSGGVESATFIATYALKAFFPIFLLQQGQSPAVAGAFFAIQEAAHMVAKPAGGRLADRYGYLPAILIGMTLLAVPLMLLPHVLSIWAMFGLAVFLGVAEGALTPATSALIAAQLFSSELGTGMGVVGTMRNLGKVVGPLAGGLLLARFDFKLTFLLLGLFLLLVALLTLLASRRRYHVIEPVPQPPAAD